LIPLDEPVLFLKGKKLLFIPSLDANQKSSMLEKAGNYRH
jgi:hypothetical protein